MFELAVAIVLILLNGVFALSELAIVSSRKARLTSLADEGRGGARTALLLAEHPGRFLSTVQIGITLVGILAGAFSGAALSAQFDTVLEGWGLPTNVAEPVAYAVVIGAITYFSVIIGELVPKQLALRNPEAVACLVARPMAMISRAAAPLIWLLDSSSRLVFRLFGMSEQSQATVTEQDIKALVAEAESAGVIETHERAMIAGVLRLGDRRVTGVMTPRPEVEWLNLQAAPEEQLRQLLASEHSRLPAGEGSPDEIVGVLQLRDLSRDALNGAPVDMRSHIRGAPVVPETIDALEVLETLRAADVPMALVYDEYGHFLGIVTPADILDAIAGAFRADEDPEDAVQRDDGSWLLEGSMPADEMADLLNLRLEEHRDYNTVAGFVIDAFQRLPRAGESIDADGWTFEVVDLDGQRVDKVLARPAAA